MSLVVLITFVFLAFPLGALAAPPDGIQPKAFKVGKVDVISYLPDNIPMPNVQALVEDKTGKRAIPARVTHRLLDNTLVDGEPVVRGETLIITGIKETDVGILDEDVPLPGSKEDSDMYSVMYQYQRVEWLYKTRTFFTYYQVQKNDCYWERSRTNLTIPSNGAYFETNVQGNRWSDDTSYVKWDKEYMTPTWKTSYETYHCCTTSPHNTWEFCNPIPPQENYSLVTTKIYDAFGQVGTIATRVNWAS